MENKLKHERERDLLCSGMFRLNVLDFWFDNYTPPFIIVLTYAHTDVCFYSALEYLIQFGQSQHSAVKYFCIMTSKLYIWLLPQQPPTLW